MRRFFFTILFTAAATAAMAQPIAPGQADPVPLLVSRTHLQLIGNALMELPYKTASPVLVDLQRQLDTADKAAAEKAKAEPAPAEPAK